MENSDQQIKIKLQKLLSLLNNNAGGNYGKLSEGENNFIITYSATENGVTHAKKFLDKLKDGGLLKEENFPKIDPNVASTGINIAAINSSSYLKIDIHKVTTQITFTPHKEYNKVLQGLDKAIASAENDIIKHARIRMKLLKQKREGSLITNMPTEPNESVKWQTKISSILDSSPEIIAVSEYLKDKVDASFPNSNVNVTYSAANIQTGNPAFILILDYKDGKDYSAFNNFKDKVLDKIFPKGNTFMFRVNKEDSKIGINVSGDPSRLLKDIERNDHANSPKIAQSNFRS